MNNWTDAKTELPDADTIVLVFTPSQDAAEPVWLGYYDDEVNQWRTPEGSIITVTHWQSLPETPARIERTKKSSTDLNRLYDIFLEWSRYDKRKIRGCVSSGEGILLIESSGCVTFVLHVQRKGSARDHAVYCGPWLIQEAMEILTGTRVLSDEHFVFEDERISE